jgi:hypothetical protein
VTARLAVRLRRVFAFESRDLLNEPDLIEVEHTPTPRSRIEQLSVAQCPRPAARLGAARAVGRERQQRHTEPTNGQEGMIGPASNAPHREAAKSPRLEKPKAPRSRAGLTPPRADTAKPPRPAQWAARVGSHPSLPGPWIGRNVFCLTPWMLSPELQDY